MICMNEAVSEGNKGRKKRFDLSEKARKHPGAKEATIVVATSGRWNAHNGNNNGTGSTYDPDRPG